MELKNAEKCFLNRYSNDAAIVIDTFIAGLIDNFKAVIIFEIFINLN